MNDKRRKTIEAARNHLLAASSHIDLSLPLIEEAELGELTCQENLPENLLNSPQADAIQYAIEDISKGLVRIDDAKRSIADAETYLRQACEHS